MKKIFFVIFLTFALVPGLTEAICEGPIVPCGGTDQPACQFCHIFVLVNNIINFVLTCLTPIAAALMLVVGGLMLMLSYLSEVEILPGGTKGGPKLLSQARGIITATVVGLVIIFIAWVFLNTLLTYIGVTEWTGLHGESGNWWQINCH